MDDPGGVDRRDLPALEHLHLVLRPSAGEGNAAGPGFGEDGWISSKTQVGCPFEIDIGIDDGGSDLEFRYTQEDGRGVGFLGMGQTVDALCDDIIGELMYGGELVDEGLVGADNAGESYGATHAGDLSRNQPGHVHREKRRCGVC